MTDLNLASVLSQPLGTSIHDLDFVPDLLGEGYEQTTVELGDDPDGDPPADGLAARLRAFFEMLDSWRLRAGAVGLGVGS